MAIVDDLIRRRDVAAELRKQADEHEARAAASKEELESLIAEAAGLEAKLAPIETTAEDPYTQGRAGGGAGTPG